MKSIYGRRVREKEMTKITTTTRTMQEEHIQYQSVTLVPCNELIRGQNIIYEVLTFSVSETDHNRPANSIVMRVDEASELIGLVMTGANLEEWTHRLEQWTNERFIKRTMSLKGIASLKGSCH